MDINEICARVFLYSRKYLKLNQKQFAKELRVNQTTISKVERAIHFPNAITLQRLEAIMGKSVRELARLSR
ncbi:helix-turn-helix transcriptional regulator [Reichenbachiella versicolor]|uniref:helix-turn-helix transcriptional regulator n=1 Tax=Reichenbachiella versicolor TaxID=1821036 RepID=UPI000D6E5A18|nr:helix-turn-helix transcriptional regulator [Reichenbachiella versicolor]